jgi:5,10-methylenetetrahydromethanopterin reductase
MRIGVSATVTGRGTLDDIIAEVVQAEADGFASYWASQTFGFDTLTALTLAGRATNRIELGTAVIPTYPRHPFVMAQQALTTQAAIGGRLCLGIGLSHALVVEGMWGLDWSKPIGHLRDYLAVMMPLVRGDKVDHTGKFFTGRGALVVPGATAVPVLVAALGTQMLQLTGALADGTATWCVGPRTLADHIIPTISEAAAAAGRPAPRIVSAQPILVTEDVEGAKARAAKVFAIYGQLPSYRAMMDKEGVADVSGLAIVGSEAEVEDQVAALAAIGVTDFQAGAFGGSPDDTARTRALLKGLVGKL